MARINRGSWRIDLDGQDQVICPYVYGHLPDRPRKMAIMSDEETWMCKLGHLHYAKDFPRLTTNDIKDNQIYTREG